MIEKPDHGGDTLFADMHEAYIQMPEDLKSKIKDLRSHIPDFRS